MVDFLFFDRLLSFADSLLRLSVPWLIDILFLPICLVLLYSLLWLFRHIILSFIK